MNNKQKYSEIFCNTFDLTPECLPGLKYQDIAAWDSVGHMCLIAVIEEAFDIMMDTDSIIDFSSYEMGMEILQKEFNLEF